ncbi:unnamed protein product, partial [Ectocarpus fasciculatus]
MLTMHSAHESRYHHTPSCVPSPCREKEDKPLRASICAQLKHNLLSCSFSRHDAVRRTAPLLVVSHHVNTADHHSFPRQSASQSKPRATINHTSYPDSMVNL